MYAGTEALEHGRTNTCFAPPSASTKRTCPELQPVGLRVQDQLFVVDNACACLHAPCRFASLVQSLVPQQDTQSVAMVLACLDSVYTAEYQQLAAEAIAALNTTNQVSEQGGFENEVSVYSYTLW